MRREVAVLEAALFTPASESRWGLPLIAWSEPGTGKTSVLREVAASWDLPCVVLSPGEMGEGAFGVVPVPEVRAGRTVLAYPPPEWVAEVADGGLVFVDEISSTPPALTPPLLGLLFARRIGGTTLGPRVRMLGAANPPELAASGWDLPAPVANRCGHLDWEAPSPDEHAAYMLRANDARPVARDPYAEEARVLAAWPAAWARAVGLETAFLHARPALKNACPKTDATNAGRAWPSDRSWEYATRALASAEVHHLDEENRDLFGSAFVGIGAWTEFAAFVAAADLPDPAALLDGLVEFRADPRRLDRTAAVLAACVALVAPPKAMRRAERARATWALLAAVAEEGSAVDLCTHAIQQLIAAGLLQATEGAAVSALRRIYPAVRDAKIQVRP